MLYAHERLVSQKEQSRHAAREYALWNAFLEHRRNRDHVKEKSHRRGRGVRTILARAFS